MKNKKKIIVLSAMIVLLVASAFLNVWLNNKITTTKNPPIDNGAPNAKTAFNSIRSDRETTRQEIFEYLDAIMLSEKSSAEAKSAAEAQKNDICTTMQKELLLETLIKSRGFEDAIVTMSTNNITVVVVDNDLQSNEVAQILSIVTSQTDYKANEVYIWPY